MADVFKKEANLIWIDIETSGIFPDKHKILEIALVITDSNLNIIAKVKKELLKISVLIESKVFNFPCLPFLSPSLPMTVRRYCHSPA